jgi:hypothetical protein
MSCIKSIFEVILMATNKEIERMFQTANSKGGRRRADDETETSEDETMAELFPGGFKNLLGENTDLDGEESSDPVDPPDEPGSPAFSRLFEDGDDDDDDPDDDEDEDEDDELQEYAILPFLAEEGDDVDTDAGDPDEFVPGKRKRRMDDDDDDEPDTVEKRKRRRRMNDDDGDEPDTVEKRKRRVDDEPEGDEELAELLRYRVDDDSDLEEEGEVPLGQDDDELPHGTTTDEGDPEGSKTEYYATAVQLGLVNLNGLRRHFPILAENVTKKIVKVTKKSKLQALTKQTALQMAKDNKDPLYGKYAKARKMFRDLRQKIYTKYAPKASKKAKTLLQQINKGDTVRLKQ